MRGNPLDTFVRWLQRENAPITLLLILGSVVGFVLSQNSEYREACSFIADAPWQRPWTFFSYLFVNPLPLSVLFCASWLWSIGGSLERGWGSRQFGIYLIQIVLATAVSLWFGSALLGRNLGAASLWLPVFAMTVAFCMVNPSVSFFNFITAQAAIYLAFGLAFLGEWPDMQSGFFGTGGCASSYALVRWRKIGVYRAPRTVGWRGRQIELDSTPGPVQARPWNPFESFARWKRKRDFARLMRKSGFDDEIGPRS